MRLSDLDAMLGPMTTRVPVAAESAVRWLSRSDEPAIRSLVRQDLLDEPASIDASLIMEGSKINALLSGQGPDGGFGGIPVVVGDRRSGGWWPWWSWALRQTIHESSRQPTISWIGCLTSHSTAGVRRLSMDCLGSVPTLKELRW